MDECINTNLKKIKVQITYYAKLIIIIIIIIIFIFIILRFICERSIVVCKIWGPIFLRRVECKIHNFYKIKII